MHVGTLDGSGGVLFANGTIINVTRTIKDNKPVPITMGDDLRVDGEIWRGPKKGIADNMPLKISDTMVPTMNNINDLGDSMRMWRNLYLSGNLQGNNAIFTGDVDFTNANITGLATTAVDLLNLENTWTGINHFQNAVNFTGNVDFSGATVTGIGVAPHDHDSEYLKLTGGILTGLTTVNATLRVKEGGYASGGVSITTDGDIMAGGGLITDGNINANSIDLVGNVDAKGGAIIGTGSTNVLITGNGNAYLNGKIIIPNGAAIPADPCITGELYLETTIPQLYGCTSSAWSAL